MSRAARHFLRHMIPLRHCLSSPNPSPSPFVIHLPNGLDELASPSAHKRPGFWLLLALALTCTACASYLSADWDFSLISRRAESLYGPLGAGKQRIDAWQNLLSTEKQISEMDKLKVVNAFFNKAHQVAGRQPRALADSVVQYALAIEDLGSLGPLVARIAHRHCALSVLPEHYGIVHSNLMGAIGEVLGDAVTPEIGEAWSEAVLALAQICIDAEEDLYKVAEQKQGGWRYEREFEVKSKTPVADEAVQVSFAPTDGYDGGFDFVPGQYTTLRIAETDLAPRHYTLIGTPNSQTLDIAVRRDGKGAYSNYIHDNLKEGDKVRLGAPYGLLHDLNGVEGNMAFVSGGIGITPMMSLLRTYGDRVKAGLVINKTDSRTAFKEELMNGPGDMRFFTTEDAGRPNMAEEAKQLVEHAGADANFFVCGPTSLMNDTAKALNDAGANKIYFEIFGTGTIDTNLAADEEESKLKCPVDH